jgi:hypothetical protein
MLHLRVAALTTEHQFPLYRPLFRLQRDCWIESDMPTRLDAGSETQGMGRSIRHFSIRGILPDLDLEFPVTPLPAGEHRD